MNMQNISAEDVIAQASIYGASEEELQAAILGLAEYQGVTETATCKECGLEFPSDDPLADVFGPSEIKCPRCYPHMPEGAAGIRSLPPRTLDLALAPFLLDEPAGENGQYPYGLGYEAGDDVAEDGAVEALAAKFGIEIEWADSPEEYKDGSGYWPFRVVA